MINTVNSKNFRIQRSLKLRLSVAERLFRFASEANARRDNDAMGKYGESLITSGLPAFVGIGHHFAGLGLYRSGDCLRAMTEYERSLSLCPEAYRARVLLSIGAASEIIEGDNTKSVRLCESVISLSTDPVAVLEARRALAIFRSLDGDHRRALAMLEAILPAVEASANRLQALRYHHLNSLAVELNACGQPQAALKVSAALTACPYRHRFPEWKETVTDIETSLRRSKVLAFPQTAASALRDFNRIFEPNLERLEAGDIQALTATLKRRLG